MPNCGVTEKKEGRATVSKNTAEEDSLSNRQRREEKDPTMKGERNKRGGEGHAVGFLRLGCALSWRKSRVFYELEEERKRFKGSSWKGGPQFASGGEYC